MEQEPFVQDKEKTGMLNIKDLSAEKLNMVNFRNLPKHIAIIMDGNGRWAQKRGLQRFSGHRAGTKAIKAIVRTAAHIGIKVLTIYAFSTENWKRPRKEVEMLMQLFSEAIDNEIEDLCRNNVKMRFIGIVEELSKSLQKKIEDTQARTANNTGLILNVAINYGGRSEITRAVQIIAGKVKAGELNPEQITEATIGEHLYTACLPDPDLLIRPSGDYRISNYLLWQLAYSELWFTSVEWPDFTPDNLLEAIIDYQKRERRFGGLVECIVKK